MNLKTVDRVSRYISLRKLFIVNAITYTENFINFKYIKSNYEQILKNTDM